MLFHLKAIGGLTVNFFSDVFFFQPPLAPDVPTLHNFLLYPLFPLLVHSVPLFESPDCLNSGQNFINFDQTSPFQSPILCHYTP